MVAPRKDPAEHGVPGPAPVLRFIEGFCTGYVVAGREIGDYVCGNIYDVMPPWVRVHVTREEATVIAAAIMIWLLEFEEQSDE